ncbi:MAG: SDR family oxidoreductase [Hahellaceae bacterium]|nr:SDR family oxidoreductase [Hahellaceae bacterium]
MTTKTVLITGASSGIGYAIAKRFASEGYAVVLVARRKEKLDAVAKELKQKYATPVTTISHDLSAHNAARTLYTKMGELNINVDVLVNNAGRGHYGQCIDLDVEMEEETIALNVTALTSLSKLFGKAMASRHQGHIINIASIAAFIPGPGMAVYNASKAFVLSFSEALHEELRASGVGVTASCPGPTESEFFELAGTDKMDNLKYAQMMSADVVADEIYKAMIKNKSFVVHGASNKLVTMLPRTMPRTLVARMVKALMK